MKYGFLFGTGAEYAYKLPSGGRFALDIFRQDTTESKNEFKEMRKSVDSTTPYAADWLPENYLNKNISFLGKVSSQISSKAQWNIDAVRLFIR